MAKPPSIVKQETERKATTPYKRITRKGPWRGTGNPKDERPHKRLFSSKPTIRQQPSMPKFSWDKS